jgi:hypothetical protein
MNWKETYTKIFLKQLGKDSSDTNVKSHLPLWWKNTRNRKENGLRLTDEGWNIIHEIGVTTYEIPFPAEMPLTTQVIIFLDKFIDCPYYLTQKAIHVLGEKKAVELTLFSGDIRKYGLNKAMTRSKKLEDNG